MINIFTKKFDFDIANLYFIYFICFLILFLKLYNPCYRDCIFGLVKLTLPAL